MKFSWLVIFILQHLNIFSFLLGCTHSIWKLLGWGLNPSYSCDLCHSCSNAGSLTHCAGSGIKPALPQRQWWIINPVWHSRKSLNKLTYCCLFFKVPDEKSAGNLFEDPLYMMSCFSLAVFKILSLPLVFDCLIIVCVFFSLSCLELLASWICRLISCFSVGVCHHYFSR